MEITEQSIDESHCHTSVGVRTLWFPISQKQKPARYFKVNLFLLAYSFNYIINWSKFISSYRELSCFYIFVTGSMYNLELQKWVNTMSSLDSWILLEELLWELHWWWKIVKFKFLLYFVENIHSKLILFLKNRLANKVCPIGVSNVLKWHTVYENM